MPPRKSLGERRLSFGTRITNIFRLRPTTVLTNTTTTTTNNNNNNKLSYDNDDDGFLHSPTSVVEQTKYEVLYENKHSNPNTILFIPSMSPINRFGENNHSPKLPNLDTIFSDDENDDGFISSSPSLCSSDKKIDLHVSYHSYDQKIQSLGIPIQVQYNSELDVTKKVLLTRNTSSLTFSQDDDYNIISTPLFVGSIKEGSDTIKFDFSTTSLSSSEEQEEEDYHDKIPSKIEVTIPHHPSPGKYGKGVMIQMESETLSSQVDKELVPTQVLILEETSVPTQVILEEKSLPVDKKSIPLTTDVTINVPMDITCGMHVDIIGGTYKGKSRAVVIKVMNKMVRVRIPGDSTERNVQKSSVQASRMSPIMMYTDTSTTQHTFKQLPSKNRMLNLSNVPPMESLTTSTTSEEVKILSEESSSPPTTVIDTVSNSIVQNKEISIGSLVDVVGGLYKGTKGAVIVKITDKMVRLRLPGSTNEKMVKKQSVQLSGTTNEKMVKKQSVQLSQSVLIPPTIGSNLEEEVEEKEEPLDERFDGMTMDCDIIPSNEKTNSKSTAMDDFKFLDGGKSPFMIGTFYMLRVIASTIKPDPNFFLEYQWGNRLIVKDIRVKENASIETTMKQNGCVLQLISAKIYSDNTGFAYQSQDYLRLAYAIVSGPHLQSRWVKEELLKIGDFASLSTSKVVSRLELLQSPAHKLKGKSAIQILDASLFCEVEEMGHVGCGFISEEILYKVCGSTPTAKRVTCIQVRLVIPRMGIFKGVLMRKQIETGPPIQLPTSMRKVGPSSDPTYAHLAFLLICQAGIDPSSNNIYVGRLPSINPSAKPPPKSFRVNPLSDMITRLFKGLQVPSAIVDEYAKQSSRVSGLKHAFVRGVSDPTGKIPENFIYLTGVSRKEILGDSIFITRSPCIKCSDARRVQVIRQRPPSMTADEWNFLETLHFGTVIFGFPKKGFKTLPEMIASGDLDGDRYFVCWSEVILKYIVTDALDNALAEVEDTKPMKINPAWFEDAQRVMIDSASRNAVGQLIGKLYTLSLKAADESELFMRDPKAIAFADAYTDALDNFKHGNKILLPLELHERVPAKLRLYLAAKDP